MRCVAYFYFFGQKFQEILELVGSCRYLAAQKAYEQLVTELKAPECVMEIKEKYLSMLLVNPEIQSMLERCPMVQHSLHFVDESEDWILGAEMFGIRTHYKKCEDDANSIIVKIEGTMDDLPLFEQMAVLHEIDLYKEWAPFCTDSVLIDKIGKAELYG